ncbi:hypothetical protein niasHT_026244 [Heterodera trifolii]|uniref:Uncharacterized protein n=1 Tax=Heterodera trifolii TaxID=157864 RepID=A0ABD2JC15_9BILA
MMAPRNAKKQSFEENLSTSFKMLIHSSMSSDIIALALTDQLPATLPSFEGRRFGDEAKSFLSGYKAENLELFLKEQFGHNKRMANLRCGAKMKCFSRLRDASTQMAVYRRCAKFRPKTLQFGCRKKYRSDNRLRTCGLLVTDKLPATVPSSEGRRFLRRGKHPLFGSYAPENLELFLKEQFGPNKRMCNLRCGEKMKLFVTATKIKQLPPELVRFRTYRSRFADDSTGPQKIRVWKAARYSSAAPTYFPSLDKYIDGDDVAPNSGE